MSENGMQSLSSQLELNDPGLRQHALSEIRRRMVEKGILAAQEVEHERDDLQKQLAAVLLEHRACAAELEALKVAYSRQQTEIESYRRERDQAVARRAEVEAVFAAALTIMQTHRGETVLSETEKQEK